MKSHKISARVSQETLDQIDQLVKEKLLKDRSTFFRLAIDQMLKNYADFEHTLKAARAMISSLQGYLGDIIEEDQKK